MRSLIALLLVASCSSDDGGGGGGGGGMYDAERQFCVDTTNDYRATVGLPPLARSATLEAFADEGAMIDAQAMSPHQHFSSTNGGNGVTFAENEIPWWDISFGGGTIQGVIDAGLAQMWGEGPGGGHYENMTGPYTELGCGIYVDGANVTVVQDYR